MAPRQRRKSAFTLLEMLVAMTLMSVLAGSLYASLHIAFTARRSAVSAIEPVRAAQLAIELVREDIESALPPTGILAGAFYGQDLTDSAGRDADALLFYSSALGPEAAEGTGDITRIELAFVSPPDATERVLVRRSTTNLLAPETVEPSEEILCRGVLGFNLRYFDGSDWQDSWDSSSQDNVLPLAVEVALEVDRPTRGEPVDSGYALSRVFLLPCSRPAADEGTVVIGPSSR